ncbi:MAG: thioredoxin family protein [Actinobacteria bacterium]|nr:thioredoxin family protein [Actinomycetota bacterium]MBU1944883.1 thioredoxin family protein [Actinomycetota bacterium]MBU2688087.1 thioredoxin family protein [Actinomycetota bacterium]
MKITILGPGCARCHETHDLVLEVLAENAIEADVEFVTDRGEIDRAGITATPAVIVDERLMVLGRVPRRGEVEGWLVPGKEIDRWWTRKR